jgi:oxygen-independent coproporphyrinogen-3 oxidase
MMKESVNTLLIRKYNQPLPRYTSYPTVPFWEEQLNIDDWISRFSARFDQENHQNGIAIYVHLPFCESLCTYCGCNKKITTNHKVEEEYLSALQKEWKLYKKLMNQTPVIRELHLGGGTPTFFSTKNLGRVIDLILSRSILHPQHEFSIEAHPNHTSIGQLKMLYDKGFRRISFGVQDNNAEVQRVINRIQPFENVIKATQDARAVGFTSINFDLIYGLPLQTVPSIERTINEVIQLMPDRIAFYSYAHVPWTSKAQRLFDETNLPSPEEKLALYMKGKELLLQHGYVDVGMDHFTLPSDDLYKAWSLGQLHRSFMGYGTQRSGLLMGLGVSSISDTGDAYAQNSKTLHDYYEAVEKGEFPIQKGYLLTETDVAFKNYILDIACKGKTTFREREQELLQEHSFPILRELEKDGLVSWNSSGVKLTEQGHYFIRNVCSAFDLYLGKVKKGKEVFSKAI